MNGKFLHYQDGALKKDHLIFLKRCGNQNKELLKQIEKEIQKGHKVALWPDSMKHKDINDMIMAGYTKKQIQEIIDDNTFSGIAAQQAATLAAFFSWFNGLLLF